VSANSQGTPNIRHYQRLIHMTYVIACPVCGALVLGEAGWDEGNIRGHLAWHDSIVRGINAKGTEVLP
jgi:hypothetical protein